jgi:NSS family neurotransmitter:Na+ symporter
MIVYGSYLPVDDNILKKSVWITVCDFAIAVLSGIAIFPAVFACGQDPTGGPGLVYQVLPMVFNSLGGIGRFFSIVFFLLLALAALTSAISLLEALTQWLSSEKVGRAASAILMSAAVVLLAVAASLSFGDGIWSGFKLGGMQLFDLLDKLTGTILPPVCALMTILFFGWFMKKDDIIDELSNHGTVKIGYFKVFYYFLARIVAPLALLIVLISGLIN